MFSKLLVAVLATLFSVGAYAEDTCSCPVVKCDPCQAMLLLDEEEKSCGKDQKIVCRKIVCENVDNYFQCLGGAQGSYVPPQSLEEVLTTPRDLKAQGEQVQEATIQSIYGYGEEGAEESNFKKPDIQVKELSLDQPSSPKRSPASVNSATNYIPQREAKQFKIKNFVGNKKSQSAQLVLSAKKFPINKVLRFSPKDRFEIHGAKEKAYFTFITESKIEFRIQQDTLVAFLEAGGVDVSLSGAWNHPLVFDLDEWRIGKSEGKLSLFWHQGNLHVKNKESILWLRRDELISKAEQIPEATSFQVSAGRDLIAFSKQKKEGAQNLPQTLVDNSTDLTNADRQPANEGSICSAPSGQYEQCAWKCFGSDTEDKKCRTEKDAVNCVRFTCSIDGFWKLPTLSPGSQCPVQGTRVGRCQ